MSDFSESYPGQPVLNPISLPISSIVRAVCEAASQGPDQLYEVMMKMSLMALSASATVCAISRSTLKIFSKLRS